jgi:hypothetical protein
VKNLQSLLLDYLQQVILNLCINAREALEEAGPEKPELHINAEPCQFDATQGTLLGGVQLASISSLKSAIMVSVWKSRYVSGFSTHFLPQYCGHFLTLEVCINQQVT